MNNKFGAAAPTRSVPMNTTFNAGGSTRRNWEDKWDAKQRPLVIASSSMAKPASSLHQRWRAPRMQASTPLGAIGNGDPAGINELPLRHAELQELAYEHLKNDYAGNTETEKAHHLFS
ncbi:hypothetical protein MRX96_057740 [Rhipicephalus microplus]